MPAFGASLTPPPIEALAAYLRAEGGRPAWQDVRAQVQAALEAAP
jgi:mono/diheme cytochrome c family protein